MHQHPEPRATRRGRARVRAAGCVVALAAATVWLGCSVEKNYKTLSFFFDGVPDPNAPAGRPGSQQAGEIDIKQSPTYSIHRPFKDDACAECHGSRLRLSRDDSTVCLKCHAVKTTEHAKMHGPVAAGACLWCHTSHESAYPSLLKDQDRRVCLQCHEPGLLNSSRTPAHADAARGCLECHFGHGGERPLFLRQGPAAAPSPGGSTAPLPALQ